MEKKKGKKKKKKATSKKVEDVNLAKELLSGLEKDDCAQLLGSEGLSIKIRGVISTQVPSVDVATGRGGIPLGRLSILHGAEGCGKTTLALHIVSECQRQGGVALYIDKEYKLDPDYAKSIGVDAERLIIVHPPYLEKVFEMCERVIQKAAKLRADTGKRPPILIVLDSMNAVISKKEFEGELEDTHIAPEAKIFSRGLARTMPNVYKEDVALLFISQIRKKIGIRFGDTEKIAGGKAPPHWASLILKVTRAGVLKDADKKVGAKARIEVIKNQIAEPFKKTEVEIAYGEGVNKEASLIELALDRGIIKKSGAWFSMNGEKIGQGKKGVVSLLKKEPDLYEKIYSQIKEDEKW